MRKIAAWAFLAATTVTLGYPQENHRTYHPVALVDLALGKVRQTHVHVEAWVTYTLQEEDGDEHIRGCDEPDVKGMQRDRCVVFECIPEMPCARPPIGSRIAVDCITRFDKENGHRWNECHPVEHLTILPKEAP